MRKRRWILVVGLLVACAGCEKDARIKRASSMLNVKTQVATKEYQAAPTPAKKVEVADEYFRNAADFTQVIDDYLHGREPAKPLEKKTDEVED